MKSLLKILAVAAAFGLMPAAGIAQTAAPDALPAQPKTELTAAPAAADNAAAPAAEAAAAPALPRAAPVAGIGQPDGRIHLQEQVTPIGEEAAWFHNSILMPTITIITLFVLALMLYVVVRFRRSANPEPSRTTHNTVIEVVWTLVPVVILVVIAVPSIRLLAHQYDPPKADLTIKAIGNQWYWTYQYPDNGDFEIISNMLKDKDDPSRGAKDPVRTDTDGPRLLAVDERVVVPVGAVVKVIVTSNDVIHSWAVPAFWVKMDAVPGRLNETWFKVDKPGVYYGQCSELCGARHGFMPIAVEVVPQAEFAAWVHSKGGTLPNEKPAETAAAAPAAAPSPAATPAATENTTAEAPAAGQGQP